MTQNFFWKILSLRSFPLKVNFRRKNILRVALRIVNMIMKMSIMFKKYVFWCGDVYFHELVQTL